MTLRVALVCFLALFAQGVGAQLIWSEGFESTQCDRSPECAVDGGYCISGGYECSVAAGNCTNCNGSPNVVTIQNVTKHGGSYALRGDFLGPNSFGECGHAGFKIQQPDYPALPTKFYVRLYIKFDSSLRFNGSGNKIMDVPFNFYFTGRSVDGNNGTRMSLGIYSSNQTAKLVCGSTVDDLATIDAKRQCDAGDGAAWIIDTSNPAHTNGWWYFELMLDLDNDLFSMWVKRPADTGATQIYNNMAWNFTTSRSDLVFSWWNFCQVGSNGGGTIYFDDLAASTSYIGPTESTVVAPDINAVTCSPSTIQAPTTTTCTATFNVSGGTPDSYAWAAQSCGTTPNERCTPASSTNPVTFNCTAGGPCTLCLTATNTAGADTQCADPITVRYVKPSGFGAN